MGGEGIGLDSCLAVARLGLATASRFRLLAEHRSGVQSQTKNKLLFFVGGEGIEPSAYSV